MLITETNLTDEKIKELWDEYRTAKCMPNMTELMMRMQSKKDNEFLPEFQQEGLVVLPVPGSLYWVETLEPPEWFMSTLLQDNIKKVDDKPQKDKTNDKKKKRKRGRR